MISAKAQGKINLVFQVGPVRSDGYHDVASIYQALALEEKVSVEPSDDWTVEVSGRVPGIDAVPTGEDNIVIAAARALSLYAGLANPQPMRFVIEKQIPVAGGMAGGSADAAAALVALNEAWSLGLDQQQLMQVGAQVGADVPFALLGGTAFGQGTGTELTPISGQPELFVVLVFAPFGLSTKDVFEAFDRVQPDGDRVDSNLADYYQDLIGTNSLLPAALSIRPELAHTLDLQLGLSGGYLSGSGPTVWFYSQSYAKALGGSELAKALGFPALVTRTSPLGARLI
jgi:4-diphosphocytidyl-2-C-methyl-D-erythritol kinase